MSDLYLKLVNTPVGKTAAQSLGLPSPNPLKRLKRVDQPFVEGDVLIGAGPGAKAISTLGAILAASPANLHHATGTDTLSESAKAGNKAKTFDLSSPVDTKFSALIFDASGLKTQRHFKQGNIKPEQRRIFFAVKIGEKVHVAMVI